MIAVQPVLGLHHAAYRCRDAEETRAFYEDVLGLPLTHLVQSDTVPSTGAYCPYVHVFFELMDGSSIAFFDLGDNVAALPSPNTPDWINHIAFAVETVEAVKAMKERLEAHGIEVIGIIDHEIIQSIYFYDPNGIRLELTVQTATDTEMQKHRSVAHQQLRAWQVQKMKNRAAVSG